jgi:hypothetical protein
LEKNKRYYYIIMSIPSDIPFKALGIPTAPGAYLINAGGGSFPIFCSLSNLSAGGMADVDDYWLVMPNYSLNIYNDTNYSGTTQTINITSTIRYVASTNTNRASSVRLYYNNVQVTITGLS